MSETKTYWKANAKMSADIKVLLDRRAKLFKNIRKFAKEMGADPKDFVYSDWGGTTVLKALIFKTPPDMTVWCHAKNIDNGYRPRAKKKSELCERWDALQDTAIDDVMQLIGMHRSITFSNGGFGITRPGVTWVGDVAYLTISNDTKPKGCIRISDLTFEKATNPKRKPART